MAGLPTGARVARRTLLAVACVANSALVANAQVDRELPWPRTVRAGATTLTISQPQVDTWDGFTLAARVAVKASTPAHTTYGVVSIDARTLTNKTTRTVTIDQANVVNARFTGTTKDESNRWAAAIAAALATPTQLIALDRLETAFVASDVAVAATSQPLDTTPPRIVFSSVPAVLIHIDGAAQFQPVADTRVARLINTAALIVRDDNGALYLKILDGWLRATSLAGPWSRVDSLSNELAVALNKARQAGTVDELTGQSAAGQNGPSLQHVVPMIHIATEPTELIVTDGPGNWTSVHGVRVFYLLNTTGRVLKSGQDFKIYALIAGRWFRTSNIFGTWSYVSPTALPSDFAKIPDTSPIENVKASIPGTKQAREATIAAMIAETERVTPVNVHLSMPRFDGSPTFKPLEGTSLEYAANTATPIVRSGGNVYAVENGVWFSSASVDGPWRLASSVPAEVYTIPSTSPLYYVTFAHVFAIAGDTVFVGHFPGYRGTYIEPAGNVVVYGTGYTYHSWLDRAWFGAPATYGFSSNLTYTPWSGWVVAFGLGWAWGDAALAAGRGWGVYPWWPGASDLGALAMIEPGRPFGFSYNSVTGIASSGQRGALENIRPGSVGVRAREVAVTPSGELVSARSEAFSMVRPGDRVVYVRGGSGDAARVADTRRSRAVRDESANGTVGRIDDDMYAGRDGVVYRRGGRGWEAHGADGWQAARTTDAMLDEANAMRDASARRMSMLRESSVRSRP